MNNGLVIASFIMLALVPMGILSIQAGSWIVFAGVAAAIVLDLLIAIWIKKRSDYERKRGMICFSK